MTSPIEKEKRFLKLVVARHLLDKDTAQALWKTAVEEKQGISSLLMDKGLLTQHVVDSLMDDVEKSFGPKRIGGFRIVGQLGQGGMGAVYKAIQESVDREVALKVLASHFAKSPQAGERFLREAKTAGKVNHPNVISIIDVGQENGQYYMALELVSGGDAEQLCHSAGGRLDERQALEIIRDACKGLQAIHQVGLVHRDIKPANIFISDDGTAKLADLGLARSEAGEDRMTQTGATVGTPAFMSPEQAEGVHDLDIRSDIYALGATLYALVCGEPPYTGNSAWAVVAKAINDPVPDASRINNSLSPACIDLINACMDKNRDSRIQDPVALLAAVEKVLSDEVAQPVDVSKSAGKRRGNKAAAKKSSPKKTSYPKSAASKKRGPTIYLLIAAALLLLVALLVVAPGDDVAPVTDSAESTASTSTTEEVGTTTEETVTTAEEPAGGAESVAVEPDLDPDEGEAEVLTPLERATEQVHLSGLLDKVNRQLEQGGSISEANYRAYTYGVGHFGFDNGAGPLINVAGQRYEQGIAMHPPGDNDLSRATFTVPRRYRSLSGAVGLNDSSPRRSFHGTLYFVIYAGGKEIWRSEAITSGNRSQAFDVRLPHLVRRVTLETRCVGSFRFAQAVWMDPVLNP